jgi:large repetitive protein
LTASGGTPPYNWSVLSGSLPPGLSLTGAGQLTGTPASPGVYTFVVRAADSAGSGVTKSFVISVAASVSVGSCPATSVVAGQTYNGTFTASGGVPPYTWSVFSGLLPAGIRLNSTTGVINGSAVDVGNYNYTVQALDRAGATGSISCSLTVVASLTVTTGAVSDATERSVYTQVLQAFGGQPPYSWAITIGTLPPGLILNSGTGVITGTPTQAGTFPFAAQVTDASGASIQKQYTITVVAGLVVSACPATIAEAGFPYAASLTAAGGTPAYVFTISGSLPPGLKLDSGANAITGTPTQTGTFPFSVAVVDKTNASTKRDCTVDVRAGVRIASDTLPSGSTGGPYVITLSAAGGVPPYNWSTSSGSLPPGLFLNAGTGQITGTPTFTGSYSFTVQIADSLGAQVSKDFTIAITLGLVITDCPTPAAILSQSYSATLVVSGGSSPYVWSLTTGTLPPGLALQSNAGVISGTPGQAGLYPYTLRVDDSSSKFATRACSIQVSSGNLVITTGATLPAALAGVAYTQTLGASGGNAPYAWALVDGALPDGITVDAGGTISGTTSASGSYQFTAQVTDQDGTTTRQAFTLVVQAGTPPSVQITGLPDIIAPAQQPVFDVQLSPAYPLPITGSIMLTFTPDPNVNVDDPAIQFATGGRTINFSVPANSTKVTFAAPIAALQTGTVAGAIQLTVKIQSNGADITPSPAPQRSIRVDRLAPKITSMTAVRTASGFEVRIIGYSTTRDVTQGTFHVVFSNGTSSDVNVSMSDPARTWFQSSASTPFGGQFSLTQPFSLQGQAATLTSVSVTLVNAQGVSAAVSANF